MKLSNLNAYGDKKALKMALKILRNDTVLFSCILHDAIEHALGEGHTPAYIDDVQRILDLVDGADWGPIDLVDGADWGEF